jgi:hypothetical protein
LHKVYIRERKYSKADRKERKDGDEDIVQMRTRIKNKRSFIEASKTPPGNLAIHSLDTIILLILLKPRFHAHRQPRRLGMKKS